MRTIILLRSPQSGAILTQIDRVFHFSPVLNNPLLQYLQAYIFRSAPTSTTTDAVTPALGNVRKKQLP